MGLHVSGQMAGLRILFRADLADMRLLARMNEDVFFKVLVSHKRLSTRDTLVRPIARMLLVVHLEVGTGHKLPATDRANERSLVVVEPNVDVQVSQVSESLDTNHLFLL